MFPYKTYLMVTFYCIVCKVVKNITFKESGALPWHLETSRFPCSLMKLCCTLANNPWLIGEFMCLLFGVPRQVHRQSERQPRYSWAQSPLGTPYLYIGSSTLAPVPRVTILTAPWNGLEDWAEQSPSPHRPQCSAQGADTSSLFMKRFSWLVFFSASWSLICHL